MLYFIILLLSVLVLILALKVSVLKRSARELREGFAFCIGNDTNSILGITSRDRDMCALANDMNRQLRILREQYVQYTRGNRELLTAVTNISHDLRTPLTAIAGYTERLKRTSDPEKQRRCIDIIEERTRAMTQLTQELFSYSVILSGQGKRDLTETDLRRALEEAILSAQTSLESRGIVPELSLPEGPVIRLLDPAALSRILGNLINNAVKYSAGDLSVALTEEGRITLENEAPGLTPVQVEQLFDRFYTVEQARNSTGLGLSIARALTEEMGGTISAEYEGGRLRIVGLFRG